MRRTTLTDLPRLDIRRLARGGFLTPGCERQVGWRMGGQFIGAVALTAGEDGLDVVGLGPMHEVGGIVRFDATNLSYGVRRWFVCPSCSRRCSIVYIQDPHLRCGRCADFPYLSAALGRAERQRLRREVLAEKCGTTVSENSPARPKWMRAERWARLRASYVEAERAVVGASQRRHRSDG